MNKFTHLKTYLNIPEAAKYFSNSFGENITEADVFQFALDGHLKLSVNIVNPVKVRRAKAVPWEETEWMLFPKLDYDETIPPAPLPPEKTSGNTKCPPQLQTCWNGIPEELQSHCIPVLLSKKINNNQFLIFDNQITKISGICDLPMIGSERLDVEHQYHLLTGGPVVALQDLDATYVEDENGTICQLQTHLSLLEPPTESITQLRSLEVTMSNDKIKRSVAKKILVEHRNEYKDEYFQERERELDKPFPAGNELNEYEPANSLPEDSVLVVRTAVLRNFEQSINDAHPPPAKELAANERNTLLTIIAALCDNSVITPADRGSASLIATMTEEIGAPVTDETIRNVLSKIPNALESRMKIKKEGKKKNKE